MTDAAHEQHLRERIHAALNSANVDAVLRVVEQEVARRLVDERAQRAAVEADLAQVRHTLTTRSAALDRVVAENTTLRARQEHT